MTAHVYVNANQFWLRRESERKMERAEKIADEWKRGSKRACCGLSSSFLVTLSISRYLSPCPLVCALLTSHAPSSARSLRSLKIPRSLTCSDRPAVYPVVLPTPSLSFPSYSFAAPGLVPRFRLDHDFRRR